MTDLEITRHLAIKVMGWHEMSKLSDAWADSSGIFVRLKHGWQPLTHVIPCSEVMEALRAKGYEVLIHFYKGEILARVIGPDSVGSEQRTKTGMWTRAFCLAAVRATGGEA